MRDFHDATLFQKMLDEDRDEKLYETAMMEAKIEAWETIRSPKELKRHLDNEWLAGYLSEIFACLPFAAEQADGVPGEALQSLVKACVDLEQEMIRFVAGEE